MIRKSAAAGVLLAALVAFSACGGNIGGIGDVERVVAALGSAPETLRAADAVLEEPEAFGAEPRNTLIEYVLGGQDGLTGAVGDSDTPFLVASSRVGVVFTACATGDFPLFLPDGGRALALGGGLAVLARDGKTLVYDLHAPGSGPVWTLDGEPDAAWISPDGSRVALLSGDTLRVYDGANGKALGQVKAGARVDVSFARDGSMVAADGARAALVRPDGTTAWTYAPETRGRFHATLAPDGSAVYVAVDGRLEALDLNGLMGQEPQKAVLWRVDVPSGLSAGRIAASPDGRWLAVPLSDGTGLVLASAPSSEGRAAWRVPAPDDDAYVSATFAGGRAVLVAARRDGGGVAAAAILDPAADGSTARVIRAPDGAEGLYAAGAWLWAIAPAPHDPAHQPVALGYRFAPVGCGSEAVGGSGAGSKPGATTVSLTVASGRPITPQTILARVGEEVALVIHNADRDVAHDLAIADWGVDVPVPPGATVTVTVVPKKPGTPIMHCVEPGHGREVARWLVTR